jgi:hypothetical protein
MLRGSEIDHFLWKNLPTTRLSMLLGRSSWVPYLVVEKHGTLTLTRGVLFCPQVDGCIHEEVHVGPPDQYLSHPRTARNLLPTRIMFLTFENLTLLERVEILYTRFILNPCLPNPMRCFRCQQFRHMQVRCTSDISPER